MSFCPSLNLTATSSPIFSPFAERSLMLSMNCSPIAVSPSNRYAPTLSIPFSQITSTAGMPIRSTQAAVAAGQLQTTAQMGLWAEPRFKSTAPARRGLLHQEAAAWQMVEMVELVEAEECLEHLARQ